MTDAPNWTFLWLKRKISQAIKMFEKQINKQGSRSGKQVINSWMVTLKTGQHRSFSTGFFSYLCHNLSSWKFIVILSQLTQQVFVGCWCCCDHHGNGHLIELPFSNRRRDKNKIHSFSCDCASLIETSERRIRTFGLQTNSFFSFFLSCSLDWSRSACMHSVYRRRQCMFYYFSFDFEKWSEHTKAILCI